MIAGVDNLLAGVGKNCSRLQLRTTSYRWPREPNFTGAAPTSKQHSVDTFYTPD